MSLLTRLFARKPKRDLFHGIYLRHEGFAHYVFEQLSSEIVLLHDQDHQYSSGPEKCLDDVDEALYISEKSLHQKLDRIIFFIPTLAVDPYLKDVKQPYRRMISEIIRNLELEAMGYVEIYDALKHQIETTGMYMEMDGKHALLGTIHDQSLSKREIVTDDVSEIVSRITEQARKHTALYMAPHTDRSTVTDLSQELEEYSIRHLSSTQLTTGMLEVLREQLCDQQEQPDEVSPSDEELSDETVGAVDLDPHDTVDHTITPYHLDESADAESELTDERDQSRSVTEQRPPADEMREPKVARDHVEGFEVFDITDDADLSEIQISPPASPVHMPSATHHVSKADPDPDPDLDPEISLVNQIDDDTQPIVVRRTSARRSYVLPVIVLSAILLIAAGVYECFFNRVQLRIELPVSSYAVTQEVSDLPVTRYDEDKPIEASIPTTGKREVGEVARGQLAILNFQTREATVSASTIFRTGDLAYEIESAVQLEPASLNIASGTISASRKVVKATAVDIGSASNIDKGKQLSSEGFEPGTITAVTETAFTGGSSRTVSAVSSSDIATLDDLIDTKAKQLTGTTPDVAQDELVIEDLSTAQISRIAYTPTQGSVGAEVSARAQVTSLIYAVKKPLLLDKVRDSLMAKVPPKTTLITTSDVYVFDRMSLGDDEETVQGTVTYQTRGVMSVDEYDVRPLLGWRPGVDRLAQLQSRFKGAKVTVISKSPFTLSTKYLPLLSANIDLAIQPAQ